MIASGCSVDGCTTQVSCRALCEKHYRRLQRHGDPTIVLTGKSDVERLKTFFEVGLPDACWPWLGHTGTTGYGQFAFFDGASQRYTPVRSSAAHRAVYEFLIGPIPDGLVLDHLCRNRACVNPAHLEPVTTGENTRRGVLATGARNSQGRKTHCPQGHPYDEENTRRYQGRRYCIACNIAAGRARYGAVR